VRCCNPAMFKVVLFFFFNFALYICGSGLFLEFLGL
jgi:hypothetical protein